MLFLKTLLACLKPILAIFLTVLLFRDSQGWINKTNQHDKEKAATYKDYAHSINKSEKAIQDEADIYRQVVEIADYLEMEEFVKENEDMEVRNMVMITNQLIHLLKIHIKQ